jgi:hypothetical protein
VSLGRLRYGISAQEAGEAGCVWLAEMPHCAATNRQAKLSGQASNRVSAAKQQQNSVSFGVCTALARGLGCVTVQCTWLSYYPSRHPIRAKGRSSG